MLVASGTALVLLTWGVCAVSLIAAGLPLASLTSVGSATTDASRRPALAGITRRAIWWGLLAVTLFAYAASLLWPLGGPQTAISGMALAVVLGGLGWWLLRGARSGQEVGRPSIPIGSDAAKARAFAWLMWMALVASVLYLAVAALGPVTNYDSGLYHLGAIRYALEFPAIPGLANLYFPLGYGNAEFPLAALLGNGPWGEEGYRLLNGLVMTLAVLDLALRWRARARTPGTYVLAIGILAAWVPLVALSDYWVTSPTQDSFVFVATVVATAYLADAAHGGRRWLADASLATALGILLALLRPTMLAFTGAAIVVVAVLSLRRRHGLRRQAAGRVLAVLSLAGIAAASLATARDYVLSGWLQYPLSIHAFDVPWLAEDPSGSRQATLGFHRNPDELWASVEGWAWIPAWLTSRLSQWETYQFAGLVIGAVVLGLVAHRATHPGSQWRLMMLATLPSATATLLWFVATPPSYRFAWGQIFTLATIPIGWSLWLLSTQEHESRLSRRTWQALTAASVAVPILVVTAYSAVARLDAEAITAQRNWTLGFSIPYAVAPVVDAPVVDVPTTDGLTLLQPTDTDQCWWNYPLCTPQPNLNLRLRGDDLASGFLR